jgi:hypothetical protein
MWIEEMFGDLKSNGLDLESTHLRSVPKLHRLTCAVWSTALTTVERVCSPGFVYA